MLLLVAAHLPMMAYFGAVHQSGPLAAVQEVQRRAPLNATFLMPCHSCPAQSFVHNPRVALHFLQCEPPPSTRNESDVLFSDPLAFPLNVRGADLLVLFEPLYNVLRPRLSGNWRLVWEAYHSSTPSDARHGTSVKILERTYEQRIEREEPV